MSENEFEENSISAPDDEFNNENEENEDGEMENDDSGKQPDDSKKKIMAIAAIVCLLISGAVAGVIVWLTTKGDDAPSELSNNNKTNSTNTTNSTNLTFAPIMSLQPSSSSASNNAPSLSPNLTTPGSPTPQLNGSNPSLIPDVGGENSDWEKLVGGVDEKFITGDSFGSFVKKRNTTMVIGAPGNEVIYVISETQNNNRTDREIRESDAHSGLIGALSDDGSHLAVGIPSKGKVIVYYLRVYNETLQSFVKSFEDSSTDGDGQGSALSLSQDGTRIAIGAPKSADGGVDSGKVFVFDYNGNDWIPVAKTILGQENDKAGSAVALSPNGNILTVGFPGRNSDTGSVFVYQYDSENNVWTEKVEEIKGIALGDGFGSSVAYSDSGGGEYVAIGAPGYDENDNTDVGLCVTYNVSSNPAAMKGPLLTGSVKGEQFGHALALEGDILAVTSEVADSNKGIVRIYELEHDEWTPRGEIIGLNQGDNLGSDIEFSTGAQTTLFVGAKGNNETHGKVYFYKRKEDSSSAGR